MLSFIWFLIIGLVAGLLARLILPGKDAMSLLATMLLGMAGSILGGLVSWAVWGAPRSNGFEPSGLIMSIVGAILVLLLWRMVKSRSTM
jgi:uncharacterized membrane protein YeaQ/YmgE (transglycosylase-associated protein family)